MDINYAIMSYNAELSIFIKLQGWSIETRMTTNIEFEFEFDSLNMELVIDFNNSNNNNNTLHLQACQTHTSYKFNN